MIGKKKLDVEICGNGSANRFVNHGNKFTIHGYGSVNLVTLQIQIYLII